MHDIDPAVEAIELAAGGCLSLITFHDGTYRLEHTHAGVTFSTPLARIDVAGLRTITGDALLRAADVSRWAA